LRLVYLLIESSFNFQTFAKLQGVRLTWGLKLTAKMNRLLIGFVALFALSGFAAVNGEWN